MGAEQGTEPRYWEKKTIQQGKNIYIYFTDGQSIYQTWTECMVNENSGKDQCRKNHIFNKGETVEIQGKNWKAWLEPENLKACG